MHQRNKVCGHHGFSCIQLNRTIFLTRRPYGSDCWEVETRNVPSGCECMWPKHHKGKKRYFIFVLLFCSSCYKNANNTTWMFFLSLQVTSWSIIKLSKAKSSNEQTKTQKIHRFFHLQHYSSQSTLKNIFFSLWMCRIYV